MIDLFSHIFYYGTQKVLLIGIAWKVGCQSLLGVFLAISEVSSSLY